jgi:hypothetical protein
VKRKKQRPSPTIVSFRSHPPRPCTLHGDARVVVRVLPDAFEIIQYHGLRPVVGEEVVPGVQRAHGPELAAAIADATNEGGHLLVGLMCQ